MDSKKAKDNENNDIRCFSIDVIGGTLKLFVPIMAITLLLIFAFYNVRASTVVQGISVSEIAKISLQKQNVQFEIRSFLSDLEFLSNLPFVYSLQDEVPASVDRKSLVKKTFLAFSQSKKIYDQIRVLDNKGMEVVRVNYNAGSPSIVADAKLQNKGGRYYFEDTIKLDAGQIFISPLDLNIEHGRIEQPLKPMLRFGTPLFDADGVKRGMVLINYFAQKLLTRFVDQAEGTNSLSYLINQNGYYLYADNPELEWGFMFPYKNASEMVFSHRDESAWEQIKSEQEGQFEGADGLWTFSTVYPLLDGMSSSTGDASPWGKSQGSLDADHYYWKLVSLVPREVLSSQLSLITIELIFFAAFFVAALLFAAWRISHTQCIRRQMIMQQDALIVQLQEKTAEQESMVYTVSHDLKGPIITISGFMDILEQDFQAGNENGFRENLEMVKNSSARMKQLVDELLQLARVGIKENTLETVNLSDLINLSLSGLSGLIEKSTARVRIEQDMPDVTVDIKGYQHVFENLLSNAIKFSKEAKDGPVIHVSAKSNADHVVCCIKDNGIGLEPENCEKIFKIFEKVYPDSDGTGVGLAIVKRVVESHKGKVWVESEGQGLGTTFCIMFAK